MVNVNVETLNLYSFLHEGLIFSASPDSVWVGLNDSFPSKANSMGPEFFCKQFHGDFKGLEFNTLVEIKKKDLLVALCQHPEFSLGPVASAMSQAIPAMGQFETLYSKALSSIKAGEILKAVPYSEKSISRQLTLEDKGALLKELLDSTNKSEGTLYGAWSENQGFLGYTPESLFIVQSKYLETMALAGTCSSSTTPERLLEDPKERHEHALVVESLLENLRPLGKLSVKPVKLFPGPSLWHLKTQISLELKQKISSEGALELVEKLHPTPALGGYPKNRVREILEDFDSLFPRGYFGAPMGFCNSDGEAHFVVMIRGLFWDDTHARIYAGCGVVEQSVFEKEWEEVKLKIKSIEKNFGLVAN